MPKVILGILAVVAVAGWATAFGFLNKSGELDGRLETSEAERARLAEDLESARTDLEEYRESAGRLDELDQQASAAEAKLSALDQQLQGRQSELAALRNETEAGKAELAALESRLLEREAQVREVEEAIELAGPQLERLRAETEQLRQEAELAQPKLQDEGQEKLQTSSEAGPSVAELKEPDRIAEAKRRFGTIDQNGDGKLDQFEIRLNKVKLLGVIDANRDGFITSDETLLSPEQFQRFELDGDGKISPVEFVDIQFFHMIDTKSQDFVTYEEYLTFLQATTR